jgi:chromosome segregation ATPase
MESVTWIEAIVAALLGSGGLGIYFQLRSAKAEAKRVRLEENQFEDEHSLVPEKRSEFIVTAAQQSVTMLSIALDKAERQIKELEATIGRLQEELDSLQRKYAELLHTLYTLRARIQDTARGDDNGR